MSATTMARGSNGATVGTCPRRPAHDTFRGGSMMAVQELPLFPVTVVGSWSRPSWLLDAWRKRQGGRMSSEEFTAVADRAVLEALKYHEGAGVDVVSDGEQRRDNFRSFVADKLEGVKLLSLAEIMDLVEDRAAYERILKAADAPAFSIKNETVVGKIRPRQPLALDEFTFLRQHTRKPIMVPLPGPYILARSMWVKGVSDKAYPTREQLAVDVVKILRDELIALRDAGCAFVQFDEPVLTDVVFNRDVKERTFMCGSMAESTGDPSRELLFATRLLNSVTEGIDGIRTGVHVCRGNWSRKDEVLLRGSYEPLVPTMMGMKIDRLVLEFATPRAGAGPQAGAGALALSPQVPRLRPQPSVRGRRAHAPGRRQRQPDLDGVRAGRARHVPGHRLRVQRDPARDRHRQSRGRARVHPGELPRLPGPRHGAPPGIRPGDREALRAGRR